MNEILVQLFRFQMAIIGKDAAFFPFSVCCSNLVRFGGDEMSQRIISVARISKAFPPISHSNRSRLASSSLSVDNRTKESAANAAIITNRPFQFSLLSDSFLSDI